VRIHRRRRNSVCPPCSGESDVKQERVINHAPATENECGSCFLPDRAVRRYNCTMITIEERMKAALTAESDALWKIIRDPHPDVLSQAALNRNLTEEMAVFIVKGKTVTAETLGFLATDIRFKHSYKLKLVLCRNPRTPLRVVLSLLKFIRLFDMADIAKDQNIHINIRQKVEHLIAERVPSMPLGNKTALAKRANMNILLSLMESGDERVAGVCLDSQSLTEAQMYKIINRPATKAAVIRMISGHPKWSLSYNVRFALIRNFFTPMNCVVKFIKGMKTADLKDLYSDPKIPTSTKPFIFRELSERGETVEIREDEVYDLPDDEDPAAVQ